MLPTDNQSEGVVITEAPPGSAATPAPPAATQPPFVPFRSVLKERTLWLGMVASVLLLVLFYQMSILYILNPGQPLSFFYMDNGWSTDHNTPAIYWTNTAGKLYLRNMGYPLTGDYNLALYASVYDEYWGVSSHSFAVALNGHLLGEHTFSKDPIAIKINLEGFNTTVASDLLRASGPDPELVISDTSPYPAIMRGGHGIAVSTVMLSPSTMSPMSNLVLPTPVQIVLAAVAALLAYVASRRRSSRWGSLGTVALVTLAYASSSLTFRPIMLPIQGLLTLMIFLFAVFIWRRELANWLLHLRYPDDERFRTA